LRSSEPIDAHGAGGREAGEVLCELARDHGRGLRPGPVRAEGQTDVGRRREGAEQPLEPVPVGRHRILGEEGDVRASGPAHEQVARAPVRELFGGDRDDFSSELARSRDRTVARAGVADEQLDGEVGFDVLLAHRAEDLLEALRRKAFVEGLNVARRDVQVEVAAQEGLDVSQFLERLDDPRLAQGVNDAVEEAEALGIKGVPALVIGGEWLMQGCRDLSEYRQVIDKYLRERVAAAPVRLVH